MKEYRHCMVSVILLFAPTVANTQSGFDVGGSRASRNAHCRDNLEYPNGNICCLNCPAGTRMISPCTSAQQKGQCEECDDGTYTEHSNSLTQCFKCTQCRSDQEMVRPCTHSHDTECQCKAGGFCAPDQACEVCKKCSRCDEDEVMVRNCTPAANAECKKKQPDSGSSSAGLWVSILISLLIAVLLGLGGFLYWRRCRATESQRNGADRLKPGQHYSDSTPTEERRNGEPGRLSYSSLIQSRQLVRAKPSVHTEDERKVLCESLNSSASNSQHSLTNPPSYAFSAPPPRASPMVPRQPNMREDAGFPSLVPMNGEESLRRCFEYFEELDVDYHKRFFRLLGLADNVLKSKEHLTYEDKIHEFLNIWVEKEGKEASLNHLLKALLDLKQRRMAEIVKDKAVHSGHYICEDQ